MHKSVQLRILILSTPRYKLIDLGTFGGPNSYFANPLSRVINPGGTAAGTADTTISDPFYPHCFSDCFVTHAFQRRKGAITELESLPGALSSLSLWINDSGTIVGVSEKGTLDPLTGFPNTDSVLWKDGKAVNIGALGGNASAPAGLNNRDQVVGAAANTVPDAFASNFGASGFGFPFMFFPSATQVHAFLWQDGVIKDLGTLGAPTAAQDL